MVTPLFPGTTSEDAAPAPVPVETVVEEVGISTSALFPGVAVDDPEPLPEPEVPVSPLFPTVRLDDLATDEADGSSEVPAIVSVQSIGKDLDEDEAPGVNGLFPDLG